MARSNVVSSLLLLGALLLLYSPALSQFFWSDDFALLQRVRDRSLLDLVAGDFFGSFEQSDMAYWRPSWFLLLKLLYSCFGLAPAAYVITSLLLHFGVAVLIQVSAYRATGRPMLGFVAGLLFLSSPAYVEGVSWMAAALNVIPAALLLLVATLLYVRFVLRGGPRYWWLAFAAFVLSLTFKEAGYHFPLIVLAAHLTLGRKPGIDRGIRGATPHFLAFLIPVIIHYAWFNRVDAVRFGILQQLVFGYRLAPVYLENIFAVPLAPAVAWIGIVVLLPVLYVVASPRARFLLLWSVVALFPWTLQTHGSRFAYFCHVPLALFFPIFLHDLLHEKGRSSAVKPVSFLLILLALANMLRVPAEVDRQRQLGENCRSVLAWCREHHIDRFDDIWVETTPAGLLNGFGAMLDLFLGKAVRVHDLLVVRRPPFLIHGVPELPNADVPILRLDPRTQDHAIITKEQLLGGLTPVPLFRFCYSYEVVESKKAAMARIQARSVAPSEKPLLLAEPSPRPQLTADGENEIVRAEMPVAWRRFELWISAKSDSLLLMCFPHDLAAAGGTVTIDDKPAALMSANGLFHAVAVPMGSKHIVIQAKG